MSIRAATNEQYLFLPQPGAQVFFKKLVVTFLFVFGISVFYGVVENYQKNLSIFWMTVLAVLSVGLASGAVSRMAFYQWTGLVRFFVILLVLPFGLFVLGLFTSWQ